MPNQSQEEAYLGLVERNLKELKERAKALENVIASMTVSGRETKNQSDLLFNMLKTIKIVETFHADAAHNLNADPLERRTRPRKG